MKIIFKKLLKLFVIIACATSLATATVLEIIVLLRILLGCFNASDDLPIVSMSILPMTIYCWITWMNKKSMDKINSI